MKFLKKFYIFNESINNNSIVNAKVDNEGFLSIELIKEEFDKLLSKYGVVVDGLESNDVSPPYTNEVSIDITGTIESNRYDGQINGNTFIDVESELEEAIKNDLAGHMNKYDLEISVSLNTYKYSFLLNIHGERFEFYVK
jgi:hypothetical protein